MTPDLLFKITTFGFHLEIVVGKLWPFASNNCVRSTSSSLCDLRFLHDVSEGASLLGCNAVL